MRRRCKSYQWKRRRIQVQGTNKIMGLMTPYRNRKLVRKLIDGLEHQLPRGDKLMRRVKNMSIYRIGPRVIKQLTKRAVKCRT